MVVTHGQNPTVKRSRRLTRAALCGALAIGTARAAQAQGADAARVWDSTFAWPSYVEGLPDPNPPFDYYGIGRINYPYTIRDNLTDRREPHDWRALYLENAYLRCVVLPDVGGHLYSCTDKVNGEEMFYANPSLKLTQIGYRGAWAAFGVEFNFPVSHNWMTASPVDFATTENADGSVSAWVGNIDRVTGMQWRVELRLYPGRSVLEQHTTLYNRSDLRHRFYWWTNAGVEVWDDSRILYPMRFTASHGFRDVDTWPVDSRGTDNSVVGNHVYGPVSRFSHGSREGFMAVYHPPTESGVVHYSSPTDLPAKKIWSWGRDQNGLNWRTALSDDTSAYVEIQAGVFRDQETYGFLEPQDALRFTEYWLPIRGLDGLARANPDAALNLTRRTAHDGSSAVEVRLNVTRSLPNAVIVLSAPAGALDSIRRSLDPAQTIVHAFARHAAAASPYTVTVRDAEGRTVIAHTEDTYDYTPADQIAVGSRPAYAFPPPAERSAADVVALGDDHERNGLLLDALATYEEGLARFPSDVALRRAAGRVLVLLARPAEAAPHLRAAVERVSTDYESHYYLGHALLALGDARGARLAWEQSQAFGPWRAASLLQLADMAADAGDGGAALAFVDSAIVDAPFATRAGALGIALARRAGDAAGARARLARWRAVDPTSAFLRVEEALLGSDDPALWRHLAADPERILEIATDYLRSGMTDDALALLGRDYPRGAGVVTEPGMPHPGAYPPIAYYRAYVRELRGEDGSADRRSAARMPTRYVFPKRATTFAVLRDALRHDPDDATAHFLLGSLHLAGGRADSAMAHWERARALDSRIPTLHRNMGRAVLASGGPPEQAAALFAEGRAVDADNVDLYFGLDEALTQLGSPAGTRADSILTYPDRAAMPAKLVYHVARLLASAARFDEAEALFLDRFFPSEEGGTDVRAVYLEVKLARAADAAEHGRCGDARAIVSGLGGTDPRLRFGLEGTDALLAQAPLAERVAAVRERCGSE
jgi:tetratricopeptide (TPR) repeat protein